MSRAKAGEKTRLLGDAVGAAAGESRAGANRRRAKVLTPEAAYNKAIGILAGRPNTPQDCLGFDRNLPNLDPSLGKLGGKDKTEYKFALELLRQASRSKNARIAALAKLELAWMYCNGDGVRKNLKEGQKLFEEAAEGCLEGAVIMARLLMYPGYERYTNGLETSNFEVRFAKKDVPEDDLKYIEALRLLNKHTTGLTSYVKLKKRFLGDIRKHFDRRSLPEKVSDAARGLFGRPRKHDGKKEDIYENYLRLIGEKKAARTRTVAGAAGAGAARGAGSSGGSERSSTSSSVEEQPQQARVPDGKMSDSDSSNSDLEELPSTKDVTPSPASLAAERIGALPDLVPGSDEQDAPAAGHASEGAEGAVERLLRKAGGDPDKAVRAAASARRPNSRSSSHRR